MQKQSKESSKKTVMKEEPKQEETEKEFPEKEEETEEAETEEKAVDDEKEDMEKKDDEEDEDKTEKGEGESPEEGAEEADQAGNTISPNAGTPSTQDVFVPSSGVAGKRNASAGSKVGGQSPSEVSYTGKSAQPDLLKSPLYVGMSKQLNNFQKAMNDKFTAIEKSFADRISNLDKALKVLENQPVHKAFADTQVEKSVQKAEKPLRYTN